MNEAKLAADDCRVSALIPKQTLSSLNKGGFKCVYIYGGLPPGRLIGNQYSSMERAGLPKKGPKKRGPPDVFLAPFW